MRARQKVRRLGSGIYRRINRSSTAGLPWKQQGDFVTFEWEGFVEAPSIPLLFARHHYETAVIRRLLGDKTINRSLEFGCGFGRLTPTLASLSVHHTAVDINHDALSAARVAYPQLDFQQSDGFRLPFLDKTFDLIVMWTVVQHIPARLIEGTLDDIMRVLTPGGRLLLCEETRAPGAATRHCWHREQSFYEERFLPLRLTYASYIEEIDRLPGLVSPGRVMLFES